MYYIDILKTQFPLSLPFNFDISEPVKILKKDQKVTFVNLANAAAKAYVIAQLEQRTGAKNILWASVDEKAEELYQTAKLFFPGRIIHLEEQLDARGYYSLLRDLKSKEEHLYLCDDFEAISGQILPTKKDLDKEKITLKEGETVRIFTLFESLTAAGYESAEDEHMTPGQFVRRGDTLFMTPMNHETAFKIELFGDEIESIAPYDISTKKTKKAVKKLEIYPADLPEGRDVKNTLLRVMEGMPSCLLIDDDLDMPLPELALPRVRFTSFPSEDEQFFHLNFFGVLPFYTQADWVTDMKERLRRGYEIVILTKKKKALEGLMEDQNLMWTADMKEAAPSTLRVIELPKKESMPHSFQNAERKMMFLTDRELWQFERTARQKKAVAGMNTELMMRLRPNDYVVHLDHGLAQFKGINKRESRVDKTVREYLKLQYAGSDALFLPVESAEKITKFIGADEPRLTKLDSSEWVKQQKKLKKETEKIAGELLQLFAKRELARGHKFKENDDVMEDFIASFPYVDTPGQAAAWYDVRRDMESPQPMDRLVCGDVGFGKTEIALRAAFKAWRSGKQVAFLSPITILAEQHYEGLMKRISGKNYGVRVALLTRFQSQAEQKKILQNMAKGLVDIVIGTHRLLSADIVFKSLGLLIIDEEQRFGVKQKERLKELRANVGMLTMTATPIPRTLNMSLNKLKNISTITTPPPGRLPVITEVRKWSPVLIRERILHEIQRKGQCYFLHNAVKTIEATAQQLRDLVPEATFLVAHGQMKPKELEERIHQFKAGEYDVLVASTIIENGIDLARANTLFVNQSDRFGLSQLYQLRGRVGRSRTQAYAYFLYHKQKLEVDAKKRLRAIVEASELGSGFQIAMRDLEIRGAGEILGASQSGTMKNVGVSHFLRMLNQTIEKLKAGELSSEVEEEENINVEIPLSAYIPAGYIPTADEKIRVYQEIAAAADLAELKVLRRDMAEDFGEMPQEVENLLKVVALKLQLRSAHMSAVRIHRASDKLWEVTLRMGNGFSPDQIFELVKHSPREWTITATTLKMQVQALPITWYQDLAQDVSLLIPKKKK